MGEDAGTGDEMKTMFGSMRPVRAAILAGLAPVAAATPVTVPMAGALLAGATLAATSAPAQAQDTLAESRIRRMEAEIRALQRQVFPGGDGKLFPPEIQQGSSAPANATGQPATSALTDMLTRMDALETQIQRLTAQAESNANRIAQLEARLGAAAVDPATGAPAGGLTPTPPPAATTPPATPPISPSTPAVTPTSTPPRPVTPTPAPTPTPARPTGPTAQRLAAVQAIEKPQTADAADDEYSYGFRLWEAKFFPEAQQQLKLYVDKYPRHAKISYGRNLLGRAYLDEGKPREAATWFLQNYQNDKRGARAPDSLLYLGASMAALKDTNRACIALAEFSETYAAEAAGRLKSAYDSTRSKVKCN